MIDGLKTAAAALCGSLIVTAVFMMLVPSAGQERVLRLAVSLFFLLSLAAPLVKEIPRWQEDASLWESSGEEAADFQSLTESRLLQVFEQQLARQAGSGFKVGQVVQHLDRDPAVALGHALGQVLVEDHAKN